MEKQAWDLAKNIDKTTIEQGQLGLWWLGQSGYVVKGSHDKVIYIDPYLSHNISRGFPPYIHARLIDPVLDPFQPSQVDVVLLTHEHIDHTDNGTIVPLTQTTQAIFVGPEPVTDLLYQWDIPSDRIVRLDRDEKDKFFGFGVQAVKAIGSAQAVGYIVSTSDGPCFYHSGDTNLFLGMGGIGSHQKLDLAFLCINGQTGNMGYKAAILATKLLEPSVVVPNHYGMYPDNTADPYKFAYLMNQILPKQTVKILETGQLFSLERKKHQSHKKTRVQ